MGVLWEKNLVDFLLITVFLGGGAAYLTGRALANTWRPVIQVIGYMFPLTFAVRFIHFAMFEGTLSSIQFAAIDFLILLVAALLGFRVTRTNQMVGQYHWLFERRGPLAWRRREVGRNAETPEKRQTE